MSFGIAVALVSLILTVFYKYLTWYMYYWKERSVSGPKPKILKGNFEKSHSGECNFIEELHEIYLRYKSKDRFIGIFTARNPQLLILDPALAVQILTTHFSYFRDNEASKWTTPELDRLRFVSPMVCTGNDWTQSRIQIGPALTVGRLRSLYPAMQMSANQLCDYIQAHINDVDIKEASRKFTVSFLSDFIWGVTADTFRDKQPHAYEKLAKSMKTQAIKCAGYYRKTAAWPWLRKLQPERFFTKPADQFLTQLTKAAAELRLENPNDRQDVLNHLLQLQNKQHLSETRIIGHTATIFLNGFEIAATAIAHCILLLGRNQNAQKKLRKEILENLDDSGNLSFNRLYDLPYLNQCVYESIRIFPPVPIFTKLCSSPIELENSDGSKVQLQPGDKVYIPTYSFHHDEDIFENAEEFIPERFDPDSEGIARHCKMGTFFPFGDGPRKCAGMKLGLMETKIAVAEVVRKFEISVGPSTRDDNRVYSDSFLLSLEGGIHLKFKPTRCTR